MLVDISYPLCDCRWLYHGEFTQSPLAFVTGASGLIGSEVCLHFSREGFRIARLDNNQRVFCSGLKAIRAGHWRCSENPPRLSASWIFETDPLSWYFFGSRITLPCSNLLIHRSPP